MSLISLLALLLGFIPLAFLTCCCTEDCIIGSSAFTDSDGAAPSGFTVVGTAAIHSNKLRMSASNTLVLFDTADGSDADVYMKVDISGFANGDELKFIIKYKDSSNYIYGSLVQSGGPTGGTAKIVKRVAGVETVLAARDHVSGTGTVSMCLSNGMITFIHSGLGGIGLTVYYTPEVSGQTQCGIAVGTISSTVDFDNFEFRHSEPSHHGTWCQFCYVFCLQCWKSGATNDVADYQIDIATGPYAGTYVLTFFSGDDLNGLRQPCSWHKNLSPRLFPGDPCEIGSIILFFQDSLGNDESVGPQLWFNGSGAGGYPGMVEWSDVSRPPDCEPRDLSPDFVDASCPDNTGDTATMSPQNWF